AELRDACGILGVEDLAVLDYWDGALPDFDRARLTGDFVAAIRRIRPQVVLTFGPEGRTLHPDHIAVHEAATAAFALAADPEAYPEHGRSPFAAPKLYYSTLPESLVRAIGWGFPGIPDDEVDVAIDIGPWLEQKRRATNDAHRTQAHDQPFANLPEDERWRALSVEYFRLAASRLQGHPWHVTDLFAGTG
ncbi:MAG: PIG-L family deacetylase, partial [Chloroflexia bacterium]|nr:PIG-L family deacetylase [Chloroflexia bacterium]